MKCDLTLLSALSDGDLAEKQAVRVREHLTSCQACRRELSAIEGLRAQLSSLPAPEGDDGWLALSKKLNEIPPRARISWRRSVLAPAFCAVAVTAFYVHQRSRGPSDDVLVAQAESEFRGAEAQYRRALDKLEKVTAHARAGWPSPRQREYDAARAALESATEKCRAVARAQSADPEAEELLFAAYRKQINFYEEQILRSDSPGAPFSRGLFCTLAFVVTSATTIVVAEETEVSFAYVPAPNAESVVVEQPMGKLSLRGWDKPEVRIVATKRAPDAATLDRLRVNVDLQDGHIRIRTGLRVGGTFRPLPPQARAQMGIDLTVDAPRSVALDAKTWAGDLEAEGFRAGARLASTGGEVRASDIQGKVWSNSVKGKQSLSSIKGDVEADGVNGDLELDTVDGQVLEAKLVEGQITARHVSAQVVRLLSTAGGIVFVGSIRAGALYDLRTEEGDIRLVLDRAPFTVTARAPNGRVQSGFGVKGELLPTRLHGEFLGGGATLDLAALHGNITLSPNP